MKNSLLYFLYRFCFMTRYVIRYYCNISAGRNKYIKFIISLNKIIYKSLFKNFIWLSILQFLNLFLPLFSYPYLISVLDKELYGSYIFASSIVAYFIIIVNQGFDLSASKAASQNRNNQLILSKIFSTITVIKIVIGIIIFFCYAALCEFILKPQNIFFYNLCYLQFLLYALLPLWLFQGIEEMKFITIINTIIKILSFMSIFYFIKTFQDYMKLPVIYGLSNLVGFLVALFVLRGKKIILIKISISDFKNAILESFPFFSSRVVSVVNEKTNAIIIGLYLGNSDLALYDLAIKITNIIRIPFDIFIQVLYPNIAFTKDVFKIKKAIVILISSGVILYCLVYFIGHIPIQFLGNGVMDKSILYLRIVALILIPLSISLPLGASTLVVFNKIKYYNRSVLYGFAAYIFLFLLWYSAGNINLTMICWMYVLPECVIAVNRMYHSYSILRRKF